MPANDEKMWYSIKEAATYLDIEEHKLVRKLISLCIEPRTLPGKNGNFLSRRDVMDLERMLKGTSPS